MNNNDPGRVHSRRGVLRGALAGGAAALAGASPALRPNRIRPTCRRTSPTGRKMLGEGVAARALRQAREIRGAYRPPRRRLAHRLAAKLGELHAAARDRRHHHAERALLRAPSLGHRRAQSRRLPADAARPRRQAADLHARRHQAHAARQPRLLLRMRRQFRHGVARRAVERLPVHPRHGALRDVHRRAAEGAAERSGPEAQGEVAAAGRRRLGCDDALAAACEGARRRAGRLPDERRDALSGERLSGADGDPGLGGQHVGEVAAPHRGRRPALAHPRGDIEIHGSARRRQRRGASPI